MNVRKEINRMPWEYVCDDCDGQLEYLQYTIRVGGSDPLHVFKCKECGAKFHYLSAPKGEAVRLANN